MHKTVFPEEAIAYLKLSLGSVVIDATFGGGGHTRRICEIVGDTGIVVAIDQDPQACERILELQKQFFIIKPARGNFRDIDTLASECGVSAVDAVLFDIGLSQYLLEASGRGFSFRLDEKLDMRMDPEQPLTAAEIVNRYPEHEIADIIYQYGEDRHSRRIARAIVRQREKKRFETSGELADLIMRIAHPSQRHGRMHPATRTFQALRIVVNDELAALEQGIRKALALLRPGGRCVVISFHSLEDRIVKTVFQESARNGYGTIITRKPLEVSDAERVDNPRARSAKMRVIEKGINI